MECPPPNGHLIVLDYTLNCLYFGGVPRLGCPEEISQAYNFRDAYICSERSGASDEYLSALLAFHDQQKSDDASRTFADAAVLPPGNSTGASSSAPSPAPSTEGSAEDQIDQEDEPSVPPEA